MTKLVPCRSAIPGRRGRTRRRPAPRPTPPPAPPPPPRFAAPRHRALPAAARAHPKGPATPAFLPIDDHAPYMGSLVTYGRLGPVGAPPAPPPQLSPSVAG